MMRSSSVCWNQCFSDVSPQSWPPSPSASSSRGGDVDLAGSSTWWHAIRSSQRTSCWRPSSPSMAPYVAPVRPLSPSSVATCPWLFHRMSRLSCAMPIRGRETSSWPTELPHRPRFVVRVVKKIKIVPRWELAFWSVLDFSAGIPPRRYPGSVPDEPRGN